MMKLSPVTRDQFADWLAMRQQLYTGLDATFHCDEMEAIVASNDLACFLAIADRGGVLGMIELSLRNLVDGCIGGPVGYIEGLYVKPEFRGQGCGRKMVAFAESWFAERGCRDIATDAELENTDAQDFYRRIGFDETWRIVEFKKPLPPLR
jgi:aminoglycoside 6'-N-acetyltransferase I